MSDFAKITVVGVTGLQDRAFRTGLAIEQTARLLPASSALLISPERPAGLAAGIRHQSGCTPGYAAYQRFMLFDLADCIDTEFALVVQHDGWALSAENWSTEFLQYDYIGAPVHLGQVKMPDGTSQYLRHFLWVEQLQKPDVTVNFVMNGGFSLRTQKLMRAPRELSLQFPPPLNENDENLEDVWLSTTVRTDLERHGIRFAPLHMACQFSIEHAAVFHQKFPMKSIFGHHSRMRRVEELMERGGVLSYAASFEDCKKLFGEIAVLAMLFDQGWMVRWPDGRLSNRIIATARGR